MSRLYDPDLTRWLQLSGETIGRIRPAEERVGWVLFLSDEMKAFLTPEEYADLLDELQNEIDALRS